MSITSGESWSCVIEQDGPRFRWVLMRNARRMAKATRWWNSEEEAQRDYDEFCEECRKADGP